MQINNELHIHFRPDLDRPLPKNFRTTLDHYIKNEHCGISRRGLKQIRVSASGQFSGSNFFTISKKFTFQELIVIDLRREIHGFINNEVVSLQIDSKHECHQYNIGLSVEEIEELENLWLQEQASNYPEAVILSERKLVESAGFTYIRIPVLDHQHPLEHEVDRFIEIIKTLPVDYWIHLHCAGGAGRTTTFMCMLDMIHNHRSFSAEEIMHRQRALGGSHVYDVEEFYRHRPYRLFRAAQRYHFLNLFHTYCSENPDLALKWSDWLENQPVKPIEIVAPI